MAQDPNNPIAQLESTDIDSDTSIKDKKESTIDPMDTSEDTVTATTTNTDANTIDPIDNETKDMNDTLMTDAVINDNNNDSTLTDAATAAKTKQDALDASEIALNKYLEKFKEDPAGRGVNENYRMPRNFKLLDELEYVEKGLVNDTDLFEKYGNDINWINYGLDPMDDTLTMWNASIMPLQDCSIGDRFYQLKMITGQTYPIDPPFITFIQKVDLPFVDDMGTVMIDNINKKFIWDHEKTMLEILITIRRELCKPENIEKCNEIEPDSTYAADFDY